MKNFKCMACLLLGGMLKAELKMPGKLVDIGDCKLHIHCTGQNKASAPTVILDICLGDPLLFWSSIQPQIAQFARVCSYDRAGLGWSEASSRERTSKNIAEELHLLLQKAGIKGPYILVGHSSGGINMRLYANTYPEDVYGVILVDASHEDQLDRFKEIDEKFPVEKNVEIWPVIPQEIQKKVDLLSFTKSDKAGAGEWNCFSKSMQQLKESKNQLTDKPLIVITAGLKREDRVKLPLQKARMREYDNLWAAFQRDFLKHSVKSRQVFAEKSGHFVMFDQPEIVIEMIKSMVDQYHKENQI